MDSLFDFDFSFNFRSRFRFRVRFFFDLDSRFRVSIRVLGFDVVVGFRLSTSALGSAPIFRLRDRFRLSPSGVWTSAESLVGGTKLIIIHYYRSLVGGSSS